LKTLKEFGFGNRSIVPRQKNAKQIFFFYFFVGSFNPRRIPGINSRKIQIKVRTVHPESRDIQSECVECDMGFGDRRKILI